MFTLQSKDRTIVVDKPIVMGILNITPDSFFEGSRVVEMDQILRKAEQMLRAGATLLDIGGQSTRPGSERLSAEEECDRVILPIERLSSAFPQAFLSVDTYHAQVAEAAVNAGAHMVNDISAGLLDNKMLATVSKLQVPYVIMHMKGEPETMQKNTTYQNVLKDVIDFLAERKNACQKQGIRQIIIDPGIGFSKTIEQNFEIIAKLEAFQELDAPLLLGISRKSFIYKTLNTDPAGALNGSTFLHAIGLQKGAKILRVHDVQEAVEAVRLFNALFST
ncbi:MAG: dihydropteroate synthase [Bacteroidota bacterium]|jgi:dihydropteroate synthase|nr:dihydropteroate synthase [Terrimonas sp.]